MSDPFANLPGGRALRRLVWAASLVGAGLLIYTGWFVVLKPPRTPGTTVFLVFWTSVLGLIEAKNTRDLWKADVRDRRRASEGVTTEHPTDSAGDLREAFRSLRGWPRTHVIAALVGFAGASSCLILTYVIQSPSLDFPVFTLFFLIFPTFGAAVIRAGGRQPRRMGGLSWRPTRANSMLAWEWNRLPNAARVGLPVLFVVLWFQGFVAITSMQGQPEERDGHFYANDHGNQIPLTAAQYRHAVAVQQRIFATGATAFHMAAAVIVLTMPPRVRDENPIA